MLDTRKLLSTSFGILVAVASVASPVMADTTVSTSASESTSTDAMPATQTYAHKEETTSTTDALPTTVETKASKSCVTSAGNGCASKTVTKRVSVNHPAAVESTTTRSSTFVHE